MGSNGSSASASRRWASRSPLSAATLRSSKRGTTVAGAGAGVPTVVESSVASCEALPAAGSAAPANGGVAENGTTVPESVDGLDAQTIALVTNLPPGKGGPPWSGQELEQLRALYPTHRASAIAAQLGRPHNSVRSKIAKLGLTRDGPPKVTKSAPREANSAPKPKSLSAAATADVAPVSQLPCTAVPLLQHHSGQCRWIVSDVAPAVYCGRPVVGSSSWCAEHCGRVFTDGGHQRRALQDLNGMHRRRGRLKSALLLT